MDLLTIIDKGYAKEEGREATRNHLLLFPVSRLRIPKIPAKSKYRR
jgi:hypothetical protein